MTRGYGQPGKDRLWERGMGQDGGEQRGKIGTTVIESTRIK